jgi:hypothetical protein
MFSCKVHQFAACVAISRKEDIFFDVVLDQILHIFLFPTRISSYCRQLQDSSLISMLQHSYGHSSYDLGYSLIFIGPCTVIIFYYINPNKMHILQSLLYPTTALHVSGLTITHLQEHKTTVTTVSGIRHPQHNQTGSNSFTIAADSSNGVTNTRYCGYSCFVLLKMGDSEARNM